MTLNHYVTRHYFGVSAAWHDNGGSMTAPPTFSEFFFGGGGSFAYYDCTIRIYLNCNVNNLCFIVFSHYKNVLIRLCEEYKKSPNPKISTVSWQYTQPMSHIDHLRKQFKSINTYDYIITLIKRRKKTLLI